ncbi:SWIM zinc finger family protein [Fulvivirga sp. M361]|uniref:SWIM zinc finger family protein n=1 Tax=Fulvivirga sp. M361 TaxID=2594266 RepID=UPI00117A73C3|nr:SWIM zinc finger family protein [Fulvivirga sp. M361]TRX58849.1 SWIM zinc finger family protein [Fulvivirga sp. M361]
MREVITNTLKFHGTSHLSEIEGHKQLSLQLPVQEEPGKSPFLFRGTITNPFIFGKTLRTLSRVVASRYFIPANALQNISALSDPIISVGNDKIRFEGFSTCCGIYAKVDIDQSETTGIKISNGTTNVDFNSEMLNQLSTLRQSDELILEVGEESISVKKNEKDIIEKKVPLPKRWLKGLANTQAFLAQTDLRLELNKVQAVQLIRSIPKNLNNKTPFYLTTIGPHRFSTVKKTDSIHVNGVERLRLLEDIINYADKLQIFASDHHTVSAWRLTFDGIDFTLVISGDVWRGFSGEGKILNDLVTDVDQEIITSIRTKFKDNDSVNKYVFSILNDYSSEEVDATLARLATSGLLGYDLVQRAYYYRELPIKRTDEFNLNPRYKSAKKLLEGDNVQIIERNDSCTRANVKGTDAIHHVMIVRNTSKCTCTWYGKHQGDRGDCKHILAVKLRLTQNE